MQFRPGVGKISKRIIASAPGFTIYITAFIPGEKMILERNDWKDFSINTFNYYTTMKVTFHRGQEKLKMSLKETTKSMFLRLLQAAGRFDFDKLFYKDESGNLQLYLEDLPKVLNKIEDTYILIMPSVVQDESKNYVPGISLALNKISRKIYLTKMELMMLYDAISNISITDAGQMLLTQSLLLGGFINAKEEKGRTPIDDLMDARLKNMKPWIPEEHGSKRLDKDDEKYFPPSI